LIVVLAGVVVVALAGIAAAATGDPPAPSANASGQAALVTVPGQPGGATPSVSAPPNGEGGGGFAYPADGSVVRVGSSTVTVTAQPGVSSSAQAVVGTLGVSLFGGEVTVDSVEVRAGAAAGPGGSTTDASSASITGLVVLGQALPATAATQIPLANWGTLDLLSKVSAVESPTAGSGSAESTVTALRVRLLTEHGGLPAGSEILIGRGFARAEADVQPGVQPVAPGSPADPTAPPGPGSRSVPARPAPGAPREPGRSLPGGAPGQLVKPAPRLETRATLGGYVFPVYGTAAFGDTFGASRPNVSGGWHHGEDIVAPLGTPLVAVTDGTLFSVGWNDIGGWRLWLRDTAGNEFYYAHLSAYSSLARNGQRVKAGDVIGFLGKSGDAENSIPHLHFEIHPVDLLALGYDGVVAPYPFLVAWRRAEDVSFADGRRYLPDGSLGTASGPRVGAVLLEATDISRTSGLVPGALERALTAKGGARSGYRP
jgi:murein DD-endopeptidase MepM/ murein hydrolase activator NlpD